MAAIGIGNEEDNECPVCLQEIIPEELYVLHTINGKPHKFHRACITEWLRTTIETRAPFACPRCNQIDERAREELITTEGLARMPRLDLEALDHIPEDLWPPIALRLVGGIGIVTAVLSSYLVRMVFLDYERLNRLRDAMVNGEHVPLYREIPENESAVTIYNMLSVTFFLLTLLNIIILLSVRRHMQRRGGGNTQKQICINDVCYPIPDGMEHVLFHLITSLKSLLDKLNKSQTAKKGGRCTIKRTKRPLLLGYKHSKSLSLTSKRVKAARTKMRTSKK